jgi:hypothetical protein
LAVSMSRIMPSKGVFELMCRAAGLERVSALQWMVFRERKTSAISTLKSAYRAVQEGVDQLALSAICRRTS